MGDKTMPTPGPWHVHRPEGKPHRDVLTETQQCVARVRPAYADGKHHAKANARLIAAVGTAAHECAQMGYDPIKAVRALPHIMRTFQCISTDYHLQEIINRAAGKEEN
jgi:hypothetical protein